MSNNLDLFTECVAQIDEFLKETILPHTIEHYSDNCPGCTYVTRLKSIYCTSINHYKRICNDKAYVPEIVKLYDKLLDIRFRLEMSNLGSQLTEMAENDYHNLLAKTPDSLFHLLRYETGPWA